MHTGWTCTPPPCVRRPAPTVLGLLQGQLSLCSFLQLFTRLAKVITYPCCCASCAP